MVLHMTSTTVEAVDTVKRLGGANEAPPRPTIQILLAYHLPGYKAGGPFHSIARNLPTSSSAQFGERCRARLDDALLSALIHRPALPDDHRFRDSLGLPQGRRDLLEDSGTRVGGNAVRSIPEVDCLAKSPWLENLDEQSHRQPGLLPGF
jgi:hypothetical protein